MSLDITRMRLESSRTRILEFIDKNLEDWATEEIVIPTQQIAWQEGLSEHAIGTIQIERTDFLNIKLVWDLYGPNGEPIGIWLENGTREHEIKALGKLFGGANTLRWYDRSGNPIFRKKVKHPGTKGKKIIERGYDIGRNNLRKRIITETNKFLESDKIGGFVAE